MLSFIRKILVIVFILLFFVVPPILMFLDGTLAGKVWLVPVIGFAFIAYAIGGQPLLRKYFPMFAEKDDSVHSKNERKKADSIQK